MSFFQILILIVVVVVVFVIVTLTSQKTREKNLLEHIKAIDGFKIDYYILDHNKRQVLALDKSGKLLISEVMTDSTPKDSFIDFDKVIGVDLLTNNNSISKISIGGAVVGGLLAGGIGALIGSQNNKKNISRINTINLKINTNDFDIPVINHCLFESMDHKGDKPTSILLQEPLRDAEKWLGMLKIILEQNKS